jgi:hypothetical protein
MSSFMPNSVISCGTTVPPLDAAFSDSAAPGMLSGRSVPVASLRRAERPGQQAEMQQAI